MSSTIILNDIEVEITDEDGNSAKVSNDRLGVVDKESMEVLRAILAKLESIDQRLARMEDE